MRPTTGRRREGDLDGDGRDDLVVAWVSDQAEDRVRIVTDPSTTSLDSARATWKARRTRRPWGTWTGTGSTTWCSAERS